MGRTQLLGTLVMSRSKIISSREVRIKVQLRPTIRMHGAGGIIALVRSPDDVTILPILKTIRLHAECLGLTIALQKTAECLQHVATIYDGSVR
jgi:hypothetical protein